MAKVTIYTTMSCPYCHRAKRLLDSKGQKYTEIDVGRDPEKRREMQEKAHGGYTVPQIFINGLHVGGSDDLMLLDRQGKLDGLLAA